MDLEVAEGWLHLSQYLNLGILLSSYHHMSSIAVSDTINTTPRYHMDTGGFPREGLSPSYTSHCLFSPSLIVSALPARLKILVAPALSH